MQVDSRRRHDWELGCLSTPDNGTLEAIRSHFSQRTYRRDVFLAYSGVSVLQLAGWLVTEADDINKPVAFCPVSNELAAAGVLWRREVRRQLSTAERIARMCESASGDVTIDLVSPEPHAWLYGLSCVPVLAPWSGTFQHSRPFSPSIFLGMARQPRARQWLISLKSDRPREDQPPEGDLSRREKDVLDALRSGFSEHQTAELMSISYHTVHTYVKSIYKAFGVSSRGELLARFIL